MYKIRYSAKALSLAIVIVLLVVHAGLVSSEDVTLTVLHTNDVHSRFLQTDKFGGSCPEDQAEKNKCYGGFARLHYKVS